MKLRVIFLTSLLVKQQTLTALTVNKKYEKQQKARKTIEPRKDIRRTQK